MNDLELYHYGVKGMKWGARRYRNSDGTLTDAGKRQVYKSVKKHSRIPSSRLGGSVGKDPNITEAASKVLPAAKKSEELSARRRALERKMFEEEEAYANRLDKEHPDKMIDNHAAARNLIREKYRKDFDLLVKQDQAAYEEYQASIKEVVNAYLGKYGDKPINSGISNTQITAGRELTNQIIWGIGAGRIKDND